jgi:hypothetical protein
MNISNKLKKDEFNHDNLAMSKMPKNYTKRNQLVWKTPLFNGLHRKKFSSSLLHQIVKPTGGSGFSLTPPYGIKIGL